MPKYRIISEPTPPQGPADHRRPRGAHFTLGSDLASLVTTSEHSDLHTALIQGAAQRHAGRRIVSVEEVEPTITVTDDEIRAAFSAPANYDPSQPVLDLADYDDFEQPAYGSGSFTDDVQTVVNALRDSQVIPGVDCSLLQEDPYMMIEIHDTAAMRYIATGTEVRHLTDDRGASGSDAIIAIARAVIDVVNTNLR